MQNQKILLIGAIGLLGQALLRTKSKFSVVPLFYKNIDLESNCSRSVLDITDKKSVLRQVAIIKPSIIIHAASIGNVDYCEKHQEEAHKVNVEGTQNLVDACQQHNAKLVFMSSNAVFDGKSPPYNEKGKVNPINFYGKTKALAEEIIQRSRIDNVIVRLILMYGWNHPKVRENPVTWLLKKLEKKEVTKLVNDTYTNPLYNMQAAQAIWTLIKRNKTGIYHIAGKEKVNRYEFGVKVARVFGYEIKNIKPQRGQRREQ